VYRMRTLDWLWRKGAMCRTDCGCVDENEDSVSEAVNG
jgi:hypothetical protein